MCVFCEIIKRKSPAHIIYDNSRLISFLDIEPINEGHVLIVPKQHVDTIEELSDETLTDIMGVAKKIVTALKDMMNTGAAGGHFEEHEISDAVACVLREMQEEISVTEDMVENLKI